MLSIAIRTFSATLLHSFTAIYLLYAKLEEDHGLARHAMNVYDRATMAVPPEEQPEVCNVRYVWN